MSKMMLRSSGKPPLARSPIRLRPRRKALQPPAAMPAVRTPPGSLTKSQLPNRNWGVEESGLRPEYHTISCELKALAKMVNQELGKINDAKFDDGGVFAAQRSPIFERGRLYDEYCARRNERLKRKKGEIEGYDHKKPAYDLGVRVESAKKRGEASKMDSRRKAVAVAAATPVAERREAWTPRYSLRSTSKENKKPTAIPMAAEKSVGITVRKTGVRRTRKV